MPHVRGVHGIVTFSAGSDLRPGRGAGSWQMLVEAADAALYKAKAKGRDRIETAVTPAVAAIQGVELAEPAVV